VIIAGDVHSYIGNGGYPDHSLERFYLGYGNENFLTPFHLLNLVLPAFADRSYPKELEWNDTDKTPRKDIEKRLMTEVEEFLSWRRDPVVLAEREEELMQPEIPSELKKNLNLEEHNKNSNQKKSNKKYMWWISGIGIFAFLGILIYKQFTMKLILLFY
jgi:hypothetical protein